MLLVFLVEFADALHPVDILVPVVQVVFLNEVLDFLHRGVKPLELLIELELGGKLLDQLNSRKPFHFLPWDFKAIQTIDQFILLEQVFGDVQFAPHLCGHGDQYHFLQIQTIKQGLMFFAEGLAVELMQFLGGQPGSTRFSDFFNGHPMRQILPFLDFLI